MRVQAVLVVVAVLAVSTSATSVFNLLDNIDTGAAESTPYVFIDQTLSQEFTIAIDVEVAGFKIPLAMSGATSTDNDLVVKLLDSFDVEVDTLTGSAPSAADTLEEVDFIPSSGGLLSLTAGDYKLVLSCASTALGVNFGATGGQRVIGTSFSAGYIPHANWNENGDADGSLTDLNDQDGWPTSVDVSWTSSDDATIGGNPNPGGDANARLMKAYIHTQNKNNDYYKEIDVDFSDIGFPHADVYLHTDNGQQADNRFGKYTIGSDVRIVQDSNPNYDVTASGGTFTLVESDNDMGDLVHFDVDTSSGGFKLTGEANSEDNERATVNAIQVIEKVFYVATSTTAPHAAANDLVSTDISAADSDVTGEFLQFSMSIVAPRCEDVYHTCFDCASDPLDLAGTFGLTCDWCGGSVGTCLGPGEELDSCNALGGIQYSTIEPEPSCIGINVDCSSLSCTSCGFAEVPGVPFDYTDVAHSNWGSTAGWVGNNRCFYNTIANQVVTRVQTSVSTDVTTIMGSSFTAAETFEETYLIENAGCVPCDAYVFEATAGLSAQYGSNSALFCSSYAYADTGYDASVAAYIEDDSECFEAATAAITLSSTFVQDETVAGLTSLFVRWTLPQISTVTRGADVLAYYLVELRCDPGTELPGGGCRTGQLMPPLATDPEVDVKFHYRLEPTSFSYEFQNLEPGLTYTVLVTPVTQSAFDGTYADADPIVGSFTTASNGALAGSVPFPSAVTTSDVTQNSMRVTWTPSALTTFGSVATVLDHFEVYAIESAGMATFEEEAEYNTIITSGTTALVYFENSLLASTDYFVMVRAVYRDQEGNFYVSDVAGPVSTLGASIVQTTTDYARCSGDGDTEEAQTGIIETESPNDDYCACFSGYAPGGNGAFGSSGALVEACNHRISDYCVTNAGNTLDIDLVESEQVNPGELRMTLKASVVEDGFVRRIKFGTTNTCNYPGAYWSKGFNDNECLEEYKSAIPLSGIVSNCGIPDPVESDTPCPADSFCQLADNFRRGLLQDDDDDDDQPWTVTKWLVYSVDIQVDTVEFILGAQRAISKQIRSVTAVPAALTVTFSNLMVTSDHELDFLVVGHQWVPSDATNLPGVAEVLVQTGVRWPYKIEELQVVSTPDNEFIAADIDVSSPHLIICEDTEGTCVQQWLLQITPTTACSFDGDYQIDVAFECRDVMMSSGSCTTDSAEFTIVGLDATEICSLTFIDAVTEVSAQLNVYDPSGDCTTPKTSFYLGETACFAVEIESTSIEVDAVDLDYAVAYKSDQSPPVMIPLDTVDRTDPNFFTERFEVYLFAAEFPETTQGETDTYTVMATVSISYNDGSRARTAATRATAGLTPAVNIAVIGSAAGTDGGAATVVGSPTGAGSSLSSTVGIVGIVCGVVVAVAAVAVIAVVVVHRRASSEDTTGDKTETGKGLSVSSEVSSYRYEYVSADQAAPSGSYVYEEVTVSTASSTAASSTAASSIAASSASIEYSSESSL